MGGFARRAAAGLVGVVLLLTGCGKSSTHSSASRATVPPAAPTTTTVPADPYAVPSTIDAAYLNRVFLALEHIDGDATRLIVANKKLVPDAAKHLVAIYAEDELRRQTENWLDLIDKGLDEIKPQPGDLVTTANRIVSARPQCLFIEVHRDYSAVAVQSKPSSTEYVVLRPLDRVRDPLGLNPTPWMISGEGYNPDGSVPQDPCGG